MSQPTERQLKIAELRRRGDSQEAIADKLGIARSTVARDWSAIKQEMSYLPLDWSAPSIIIPDRSISQTDSAAVFVNLNSLTFERLRKSNALYSSSPDGNINLFEFREMPIVHVLNMKGIPVQHYPELSHLILKHECDVIYQLDVLKILVDRISEIIHYSDFPGIEWDIREKHPAFKHCLAGWDGDGGARVGGGIENFDITDGELQLILEEINNQWRHEQKNLRDEIREIVGPNLNFSSKWPDPASRFYYEDEDEDEDEDGIPNAVYSGYTLLLDAFKQTIQNPELLETWRPHNVNHLMRINNNQFWKTQFQNQILMREGILETDIPLANAYQICSPSLLESVMQSGAGSMKEYRELEKEGFKTVEDKEDYQLIREDKVTLTNLNWFPANEFQELTGSEILERIRLAGWNSHLIKTCIRINDQFGIIIPYSGGNVIAEQWSLFEIPESDIQIAQIKDLIRKAPSTYPSWIFLDYNPELIGYALQSEMPMSYPHAIITFRALHENNFSFADARRDYMGAPNWLGRFILDHGIAWIESDFSPGQFAIMSILESSHQQQMAEGNLFEALNTLFKGMFPDISAIKNEISTTLVEICVIHTNGIVEYIANKEAVDFDNTDAISRHQERTAKLANIQIMPKKQESVTIMLKRLVLDGKVIPRIVARIANNDTHAIRIARAIQSDDLEEATTVCWRFFVNEVHHRLNLLGYDQTTSEFVHLIDRVQEIITLSKAEINTLHNVRMIRNYVEHPRLNVKRKSPTWKNIATVLIICEKLQ